MLYNINNSWLYYEDTYEIINDYYQTIVTILKAILLNHPETSININFSSTNYSFHNTHKTIEINFNYEHTLVKQGGRGSHGAPIGSIQDESNTMYLVRIDRYNELQNADIIIDYSIPNIYNVKESNLFNDFSKKHIYIYSSIYELYYIKENRALNVLTTFINTLEPRRHMLLNKLKMSTIDHININNCFNKNALQDLYKNTKILINIHQTDHHHTCEELRILPALQCGVLVVSEVSPLSYLIPYNDYIIWSSYDTIIDKVNEVIQNYDYYYDLIFVQRKNISLNTLNEINYKTLETSILNYI